MGSRSPRVTLIGAGSLSHGKRLIDGLLSAGALEGGELVLMGLNAERLGVVGRYARRVASARGGKVELRVTLDRAEALAGADVVLSLFDAGGFRAFEADCAILEAFGLEVCVGDTVGPAGIMRGLRNAVVMSSLARDMASICPRATLVNFSNPMAPLVALASRELESSLGLCGGPEATAAFIARVLGEDVRDLDIAFAGVNHLCWALEVERGGRDLYPRFRELLLAPGNSGPDLVRAELVSQFGYIPAESSGHASEFFPWFRRSPELRSRYLGHGIGGGASGAYRRYAGFLEARLGGGDYLAAQPAPPPGPPEEKGPLVVDALLGGRELDFVGNAVNAGPGGLMVAGLPEGACVEAGLRIEGGALRRNATLRLPPILAALCAPSVRQHGLVLEALLEDDPEAVFAAIALDPLAASILDLRRLRDLSVRLLAANAPWLSPELRRPLRGNRVLDEPPAFPPAPAEPDYLVSLARDWDRARRRGSVPSPGL